MRKRVLLITIGLLACTVTISQAFHILHPGSQVYDRVRHIQTMALQAQSVQQTINSVKMLANQIRDLVNLPDGLVQSIRSDTKTSLNEIVQSAKELEGLPADLKDADQYWEQLFKNTQDIKNMSPEERLRHIKDMTQATDKTYQESLKIQGLIAQMEQDQKQLNELLKANANASGTKDLAQTANLINALKLKQSMREQQILAALTRINIAQKAANLQVEQMAKESVYQEMNMGYANPYKPYDETYQRPTGQGFIHF